MTSTAPRTRTAAEQLIVDQAVMWCARYDSARAAVEALGQSAHTEQSVRGQLARAQALGVVDGWAVIYLLNLVRQLDAPTADRAAKYLNHDAAALTPWMSERLVERWRNAAETGEVVEVPLAP